MYTILLVDDEKRMLDLLELYLIPNGYRCVTCESGVAAIRYLENNKAPCVAGCNDARDGRMGNVQTNTGVFKRSDHYGYCTGCNDRCCARTKNWRG